MDADFVCFHLLWMMHLLTLGRMHCGGEGEWRLEKGNTVEEWRSMKTTREGLLAICRHVSIWLSSFMSYEQLVIASSYMRLLIKLDLSAIGS